MNDGLDVLMPKILASGLMQLRNNTIMSRLVNRDYDDEARMKGSTVDIPLPANLVAQDVSPNATTPALPSQNDNSGFTHVQVPLDQWKEVPFTLTDKEKKEIIVNDGGFMPMNASSAIATLGQTVDEYILSQYKGVYGFYGTPGTTPFGSSTIDATQVRKVLSNQMCPVHDRRFVLGPDAEANALNLRAFQDTSYRGDMDGIMEGSIGRKFGFDWFMDQNVPVHKAGGSSGYMTPNTLAVGVQQMVPTGGTIGVRRGDIFTIAGDDQTYVVTADSGTINGVKGDGQDSAATSDTRATTINFSPPLKKAVTAASALTFKGDHTVNLAFHRDAIAFATRPFVDRGEELGNRMLDATDPLTGLSLRLEVSREHKRTRYAFDILYGGKVVRPELAVRLAG